MKLMIASDIHGSATYTEQLLAAFEREGAERMLLLGDILYHGPRNDLPDGYAPKKVIDLLNAVKDKLLCIRGNCDTEVDQMMLDFPILADYSEIWTETTRFFLTHGHRWNESHLPPLSPGTVLVHGHTHLPRLEVGAEGVLVFNPGSLSLPKGGNPASFGFYEAGCLTVRDLESGSSFMELALE